MNEKQQSRKSKKIVAAILILALAAFAGWRLYKGMSGGNKADRVMKTLYETVPGLGSETGSLSGTGTDPLAALSIEGVDIVGVIEIPALDITAPVTGKEDREEFFASWLDGSPAQEQFRIIGGRDDVFRRISDLKPGDNVSFTDIDGVRYNYRVMTQYHIKKWDMGENALQICYETDRNTYFAVGCSVAE